MTALYAYQMAYRGATLHHDACSALNRRASQLAEQLLDAGGEVEPEPDLTYLWLTSDAVRTRPRNVSYRKLNPDGRYHPRKQSTTRGAS